MKISKNLLSIFIVSFLLLVLLNIKFTGLLVEASDCSALGGLCIDEDTCLGMTNLGYYKDEQATGCEPPRICCVISSGSASENGTSSEAIPKPIESPKGVIPYEFETGIPFLVRAKQSLQQMTLAELIKLLIVLAFRISGILAFVMIVWGGIEYMISGANAKMQKSAQEKIVGAIIGLILLFAFWLILNTINPDILRTPSLTFYYPPQPTPPSSVSPPPQPTSSSSTTSTSKPPETPYASFANIAKSFANPDWSKIRINEPDKNGNVTCTVSRYITRTIPLDRCLKEYPFITSYQNALPSGIKNSRSWEMSHGMSCDVYVSTVLRASKIDSNYPLTWVPNQYDYLISHPEKYSCLKGSDNIQKAYKNKSLPSQAILIYDSNHNGSPDHTALWIDGKRLEAGIDPDTNDDFLPRTVASISYGGYPILVCAPKYPGPR